MSKYRIIEKEGVYISLCDYGNCDQVDCNPIDKKYIPRFIVQESCGEIHLFENSCFKNLKEFDNLEEARKFKRSLELKKGIVIE